MGRHRTRFLVGFVVSDQFQWTEQRLLRLRHLWGEGLSLSKIGQALGTSKNSVVGKVHRLNLPSRPSPIRPKGEPKVKRVPKHTLPPAVQIKPEPIEVIARSVAPVEPKPVVSAYPVAQPQQPVSPPHVSPVRTCQWPFGDPGDKTFRFCGCPAERGRSYCAEHAAVAFVRRSTNRDGFVPEIAVKRMENRGTLTAIGGLWADGADAG